jgi:transcriptional activator for dhaKLM operon
MRAPDLQNLPGNLLKNYFSTQCVKILLSILIQLGIRGTNVDMSTDESEILAWNEFVDHQTILASVSPPVAHSWLRCWSRINPHRRLYPNRLNKDHLLAVQVASFDLFSVARPVMEDIYQYLENTDTGIALVNGAGYILELLGDAGLLEAAARLGLSVGTLVSETQIGTNAFSLAITERIPLVVKGAEHYARQFHELAESTAPIFDQSGRPIGVLGILTFASSHTPHTLSLAVAGVRAIETQRHSDLLLAEQNSRLAELSAILASNSDGILVWNSDRILMHINPTAAKIIDIPSQALVGRRVEDHISYPAFVEEALQKQEPLTDVEAAMRIGSRTLNCVLSLRFVENQKGLEWIIVTLRPEKNVRQLVQSQVGAQALLTLDDIPGASHQIRRIHRQVRTAAAAQASILIRGEIGTGKNVLARAIHNESPRRDGPFLLFACASVPNELILGEMLGYDENLSSRKSGGRPSKFELAQGGTLFLQDVDELPLEAQAVLLNVIELGIVQRLGSGRPIAADVRIIAASSANMEDLIAGGDFRADLYYRLSAFEFSIPALRERLRDLPEIAGRILNRLSRQFDRNLSLDSGTLDLLRKYSWPGNIRELEAILGRAAVQAGFSEVITPEHLPGFIRDRTNHAQKIQGSLPIRPMDEIEKEIFLQAAQICNGNISEMSRLLHIGRTTVWRKIKEFNIPVEDYRIERTSVSK